MVCDSKRGHGATALATAAVALYILAFFVFELDSSQSLASVPLLATVEALLFAAMALYARKHPVGIELPCGGFVASLVLYLLVLCSPLAPFSTSPLLQQLLSHVSLGGMTVFGLALLGDVILSFRVKTAQSVVIVGFVCAVALMLVGTLLPPAVGSFARVALFPLFLLVVMAFLLRREQFGIERVPARGPVTPLENGKQPGIVSLLAINQGSGTLPYVASLLFMFAFGVFVGISNASADATKPSAATWAVVLAVCVALLFATTRKNVRTWSYAVFFAVFVLCVATMPLAIGHFRIPYALLMAMFVFTQIPIWLFLVDVSKRNDYPPAFLFSLFTVPPVVSYALGCAVVYLPGITQSAGTGPSAQLVMAIMAVICIATTGALVLVLTRAKDQRNPGPEATPPAPAQEDTPHPSSSVDLLCARYNLSERDRAIVVLYTQGRDVPFISAELHIAQSTVKTHLRSIYNKLGIHSKQELIDTLQKLR